MDPRDRADAQLSRARARGAYVVTSDNATSPMDSSNTQQIPRSVVSEIDRSDDPDTTTVLPSEMIEAASHHLANEESTARLERASQSRDAQTTPLPQPTKPQPRPRPAPGRDGVSSVSGVVPTTTQPAPADGQSALSRRLEGL
ncbi:hypothetical protein [Amycolatopsis sp. CA-230715]|uniref:hypothetical protein n=1 Tax=Amycolatopsis sp. CA-230715 TaxID=2745196 RepID=UPI001C032F82|nr:hypothetical protein [Amycolatopsis sp. CA-230715]